MNRNYRMQLYMKDHLPLYLFVSVLFAMGVIFGAFMVHALSPGQQEEIAKHVNGFIHTVNQGSELGGREALWESFKLHAKWIALIWVLGLSVIGLPLVFVLDFLKGVLIGFSVGYLVGQLSWTGMLLALVSIAPQNLIIIPVLVICSSGACAFSIHMLKNRLAQKRGALGPALARYATLAVALLGLLFGAALCEAYLSPSLIRWVAPMVVYEG